MDIAFLGLGAMGLPMARNLLRAGHRVNVWNRSRERASVLVDDGARVSATPADAAAGAAVAITMLADDKAVLDVVLGDAGLLEALGAGATHVSMSTIGLATVTRLAEAHAAGGRGFVSAPVFGRPEAAAAAKLFIVAAGHADAISTCQPAFDALGQRTVVVGDDAPSANVVKLSGNFLIANVIESLGEALALVRKAGVDPSVFVELLTGTLFSSPVYKTYSDVIVGQKFSPPGFALPLGLKDMGLVLEAAQALRVPMPAASLIRDGLVGAMARGMGDLDWSALARLRAEDAGLQGPGGV